MGKCVTDHLGTEYKNIRSMCKAYGITQSVYLHRLKLGWSRQEAIAGKDKTVIYKGTTYRNLKELCLEYGISVEEYQRRIRMGDSQEKALRRREVVDHLGNSYNNRAEMCAAYHIDINTFAYRIAQKQSIEDALTKPVKAHYGARGAKDHLGNEYQSLSVMIKAYNIKMGTYQYRKRVGWPLENILTTPVTKSTNGREVQDPQGVSYKSVRSMCKAHNVNPITYRSRVIAGWPIEEQLLETKKKPGRPTHI